MDVYWAHVGKHVYPGFEPVEYVLANRKRYPLFHLKDGRVNPNVGNGYDIVEFGAGDIDYQAFLSALGGSGRQHGIWEQDNAASVAEPPNPVDSFGNAERSADAILALRAPVGR
jgi:sugar phosphate isomerase/epimerase